MTLGKSMLFVRIILLLLPHLLFAIPEQPHHITAYIAPPGQLDLLPSASYYTTDHFWTHRGDKRPAFHRFRRWSALLYAEYALTCRDSMTLNGGYSRALDPLNGNCQGLEDIEWGWKHALYQENAFAVTSRLIAILPAGKTKSSIRYGKLGGEIALLCSDQFKFFCRQGWYDCMIAYRSYQGFPSNQIRAEMALGCHLPFESALIATGQFWCGLSHTHSQRHANMIVNHPSYKLLNAQIEYLITFLSHITLSVGAFGHLWGRNIGTGGGCFAGTWIDF